MISMKRFMGEFKTDTPGEKEDKVLSYLAKAFGL